MLLDGQNQIIIITVCCTFVCQGKRDSRQAVRTGKAATAAVLKLNIKEEYRDDAISLAENLVNGECDFTQALNNVIAKYPQFITTTTPKLNLDGPTGGLHNITTNDRDAFVSGVKNKFLGG